MLSKQAESDQAAATAEAQAVEDNFSHIISEMKNMTFDFGGWVKEMGQPSTGNTRMNNWMDNRLTAEEKSNCNLIRQIRNFDVHREPVTPRREARYLALQTEGKYLVLSMNPYFVRFVLESGSPHSLDVLPFCDAALALLQRFVNEFDSL